MARLRSTQAARGTGTTRRVWALAWPAILVANLLQSSFRAQDRVFRFGGVTPAPLALPGKQRDTRGPRADAVERGARGRWRDRPRGIRSSGRHVDIDSP